VDKDSDRWVRSDEARRRLRNLVDEVEHDGAHIFVLRYNRPSAVIVPVEWYEQAKATISEGGQP
jgi:prevent-host-death family protein